MCLTFFSELLIGVLLWRLVPRDLGNRVLFLCQENQWSIENKIEVFRESINVYCIHICTHKPEQSHKDE